MDGTVWLNSRVEFEDKPFRVVLDLIDGDRVINDAIENTKRFDPKTRGNVLTIIMNDDNTEREGYAIYATEQFDPATIDLRITVIPMPEPSRK